MEMNPDVLKQLIEDGVKGLFDNITYHAPAKVVNSKEFNQARVKADELKFWLLTAVERNK